MEALEKIQENYSTALGIPVSIRDTEGELLSKVCNPSKLWNLIDTLPNAEEKWRSLLKTAIDKCRRTGQVVVFERIPDSQAFLSPIFSGGQIVAFFVGGMVRFGNPNLDVAIKLSEEMNIDLDTYLDAYLNLHFFTQERLYAAANLIKTFGSTISNFEAEGKAAQKNYQKAMKNLESASNRYKRLFDTVADGIYVANFLEGTFVEINQAGAKLFGYKKSEELIGKKIKNHYVFPEDRDKYQEILAQKGVINNWVAHIITPSGEERYFETNASVITDPNSGKKLIHGVFRDINYRYHQPISNGQKHKFGTRPENQ